MVVVVVEGSMEAGEGSVALDDTGGERSLDVLIIVAVLAVGAWWRVIMVRRGV